jgi:serine/threonine protein kinase
MAEGNSHLPPRYREPRQIGHGGMGDIYRARDSLLDREVAIKLLAGRYSEDEATRQRFTREALASARLSSDPAIVTIFDVGDWDGRPFIVMEYLSGGSLEDRIRAGRPPASQALAWLEDAARALDTAHAQGIVHRDVKPGNLLLDEAGDVHVADFGIASATGMDSLTVAGTILGTAGYLSPEQAQGERATPASDRYALGVVAFELLTGRRPFARESPTAEAAAHANDPIPSVTDYAPELPSDQLDAVFRRALAKNPSDRYESGMELVHALRAALSEAETSTQVLAPTPVPVAAGPPPGPPAPPGRARPPTRALALGGLLVAALAGGAALAAAFVTGDGGESSPDVSVRTITAPGTTVEQPVTVTTTAPPPTTAEEDGDEGGGNGNGSNSGPSGGSLSIAEAKQINAEAFQKMNEGKYDEALPLAQQALAALTGSGEIDEAYANYNVGRSLIELGDCKQGLKYIKRSEQLQGHRSEFDEARAKCP